MLPAVQLTLSSCHPSLVNTDEMYFCTATLEGTCQYAAQEGRCERCGQRDVASEGTHLPSVPASSVVSAWPVLSTIQLQLTDTGDEQLGQMPTVDTVPLWRVQRCNRVDLVVGKRAEVAPLALAMCLHHARLGHKYPDEQCQRCKRQHTHEDAGQRAVAPM